MHVSNRTSRRPKRDKSLIFSAAAGYADALFRDNVSGTNFAQTYAGTNRNRINSAGLLEAVAANTPVIDHIGASLTPALRVEPKIANILLGTPPTTQALTLGVGSFTLQVFGAGTAVSSAGTATITGAGTASDGTPNTFAVTAGGTVTITITTATVVWLIPGSIPSSYFAGAAAAITGAVTQANMRISAVAGTAFVDFSAGTDLTSNISKYLRVTDSAGKSIFGYIKAAGTGETLGTEIHTEWTNVDFSAFTSSGLAITQMVSSAVGNNCYGDGSTTIKALHKLGFTSSAERTAAWFRDGNSTSIASGITITQLFAGANSVYYTSVEAYSGFWAAGAFADVQISDFAFKRVLTPSATGVTIVSTPGGATYNWNYQESGFNYNDASGYTYSILGTVRLGEGGTTTMAFDAAQTAALSGATGQGALVWIPPASKAALSANHNIFAWNTGATNGIYLASAAGAITISDGTNTATTAYSYVAGTPCIITWYWAAGKIKIGACAVGAGSITWGSEANYDGSFNPGTNAIPGAGTLVMPNRYSTIRMWNVLKNDSIVLKLR